MAGKPNRWIDRIRKLCSYWRDCFKLSSIHQGIAEGIRSEDGKAPGKAGGTEKGNSGIPERESTQGDVRTEAPIPGSDSKELCGGTGDGERTVDQAERYPGTTLTGMRRQIEAVFFKWLEHDEGFHQTPYKDGNRDDPNRLSIGFGTRARSLDDFVQDREEARSRSMAYFEQAYKWLAEDYAFLHGELGETRCCVLLTMYYNVGREGLRNFINANRHIRNLNWAGAAWEMHDSQWWWKISGGKNRRNNRAIRLCRWMDDGLYTD